MSTGWGGGGIDFAPVMSPSVTLPPFVAPRTDLARERYAASTRPGILELLTRGWQGSGEVGLFYGTSTGKNRCEDFGTYAIGTIEKNDTQITAGVSYEELNGRLPPRSFSPRR
jgi:hypothetical protein